jgi:flagellar basal body-associated protein FliL
MAEREDEENPVEEQPKKKLPLLYIILGAQALLMIGATGFLVFAVGKGTRPRLTKEKMVERAIAAVHDDLAQVQLIALDEFTVNMGGTETVIQAKINIEVSNQATASLLSQRMPVVRAKIIDLLSRQKAASLSHIQGKLQLKDAVREALNDSVLRDSGLISGIIRDVYFVDLILM